MLNTQKLIHYIDNISLMKWLIFIFLCLIPISALRDFTPANELRYISIADEALRNGHWFMLTNNGIPYSDKPPFYFWLIMLTKLITGQYPIGLLMCFSIIPALGCIYTMDKWCTKELDKSYRNLAPLMLITTGYFAGTAMVLRMDMFMVWFIILALRTFYKMYTHEGNLRKQRILFGVYILLGFYFKAFMGILIPLFTSLAFLLSKREGKNFFHYWNGTVWSIILGGIIAWFLMVWLEGGSQYLYDLTVKQTVNRSVNASVHKYPFYYYIVFLSYSVAPWTFLYVGNLIYGVRKKIFKSDLQRLFFIEIWTTFIMLSCFSSKLAIYLVPIFPFMTYLSLMAIQNLEWNKWQAFGVIFPGMVVSLAFPASIMAYFLMPKMINCFFIAGSILLMITGITSMAFAWRKKNIRLSIATLGLGILLTIFVVGFSMPQLNPEIGYGQLGHEAQKMEKEWNTSGVVTCGVWRAQNMDVYFPERLKVYNLEQTDSLNSIQNKLLIIRYNDKNNESLRPFIQDKEHVVVSNKFILVRMN